MNPEVIRIIRNILAVVVGLFIGSYANMAIITYGSPYFPLPEGVNPQDIESIKANMDLYSFNNFIIPWLAHAVGSLIGGLIAAFLAASHKKYMAITVGVVFLIGGIMMVVMIPQTPLWFIFTDLVLAYIPMAWLGEKLASKFRNN